MSLLAFVIQLLPASAILSDAVVFSGLLKSLHQITNGSQSVLGSHTYQKNK
jgi:hypothetical protein